MRIRRLMIHNFRGIKSLDWKLPAEQRLVALVGPGDSGKSTILDAIHYLLGDRWSIPFSDTDFFGANVGEPISIRAVLVDLPDAIKKENAFGLWLSGLDSEAELHQDPEDDLTPALIVSLTVDAGLEPKWSVERADGEQTFISASQRSAFSTFKVDDRNDTQLRWSRTSALGRMSAKDGGERDALAAASRAAREALADHGNSSLADLAQKVQERVNKIGGGHFKDIKPGLDTSRSSMGAGLALYEDVVPLTSFGLGSRRLASFAVQQLAAGSRAIAVVDEIEDGLEPHRAVKLLNYLLLDENYSQVLVTTHSPVIVEQAQIANLATVQSNAGVVIVTSLGGASEELQRVRRQRPSSLLAKRVVVVEGATEYGLLLECLETWDAERSALGLSTSAGEGATVQDGQGGTEVPLRAAAIAALGYVTAGFMDNDDRSTDEHTETAIAAGVTVIRWEEGHSTESQICAGLTAKGLSAYVQKGVDRREAESTILDDLNAVDPENPVSSLKVEAWIGAGMSIDDARTRVAQASIERKWFKDVEGGRTLGHWLMEKQQASSQASVIVRLNEVKDFVFGAGLGSDTTSAEDESKQDG